MGSGEKHTTIAEQLALGRTVTYFTIGVSMRPLLVERQTHVTIVPIREPKENDILLYIRNNGSNVLHRMLRQDEEFYYMRGDNTYGLEKIRKSQAIGTVTFVYKNGRNIDVQKNKVYQLYVFLWRINYPFRWLLWKGKNGLRRIWRAVR